MKKILLKFLFCLFTFGSLSIAQESGSDWYFPEWLGNAKYAPTFEVIDTVNKYGRYAKQTKTITIKDLIKFHGHFCGGLVEGAVALKMGFDVLFPDGKIDRTDLVIASNNSACGGDAASYLTGARFRFGAHFIDKNLKASDFVVKRISTNKTVRVVINKATYPHDVRNLMRKIESGNFEPKDIDLFQELQWAYAKKIVTRPLSESVDAIQNPEYEWPEIPFKNLGTRKDNNYKNIPEVTQ